MTVQNERGRKLSYAGFHSLIHKPRHASLCPRTWQASVAWSVNANATESTRHEYCMYSTYSCLVGMTISITNEQRRSY